MFQRRKIFTISIGLLKYSSDVFLNISKFIGNSQYCGDLFGLHNEFQFAHKSIIESAKVVSKSDLAKKTSLFC